jgi:hypothetical protein
MGTSGSYGGPAPGSPLVPTWVDPVGSPPIGPGLPPPDIAQPDGVPSPTVPAAPSARPNPQPAPAGNFTVPRSNFTRYARSGGNDRTSLGRAVSSYVSSGTGGARRAAQRMGSSRGTTARLANFLSDVSNRGAQAALRSLNLEALAGRPIEEIFLGLADFICPEGGTVDEGIARDAFIETVVELAGLGVTDLDSLTPAQIQTVFELYATHAIEARICNDIGAKSVTLPADVHAVERLQNQLKDFIRRGVSDAMTRAQTDIRTLAPERVNRFVDSIYEAAFEILQTMAEAMAET